MYCAIIGDIVKSKKIINRNDVQKKFQKIINEMNLLYKNSIASNFTITLGDEFQGLLFKPAKSYNIVKEISIKMEPIKFVYGIGIGEITTEINKEISIGSDGSAYHYARNMVNKAKKKKPSICYYGSGKSDELINSLIYFIQSCSERRTVKQKQAVELYEKYNSQEIVGEKLGLSAQSSISSLLKKGYYHEIERAEGTILNYLKDI